MSIEFPDGARFAFTILDDTDDTTLANGRPVYDLLTELALRTTKTVWAFDTPRELQSHYFAAETLQDPAYLSWVRQLSRQGFEIAFHNASMGSSHREKTAGAVRWLQERFPGEPILHCNHGENKENLYWGAERYAQWPLRPLAQWTARYRGLPRMEGHCSDSEYFWGDIALETFKYVRSFSYSRLDCSRISPGRPFRDPARPYVRCWFNTADAPDVRAFRRLVTPDRLDQLCECGGWTIVSTHLGKGFAANGRVDPYVEKVLRHLATLPGWFVPASELLDHLALVLGTTPPSAQERARMEFGHVMDRVVTQVARFRAQ